MTKPVEIVPQNFLSAGQMGMVNMIFYGAFDDLHEECPTEEKLREKIQEIKNALYGDAEATNPELANLRKVFLKPQNNINRLAAANASPVTIGAVRDHLIDFMTANIEAAREKLEISASLEALGWNAAELKQNNSLKEDHNKALIDVKIAISAADAETMTQELLRQERAVEAFAAAERGDIDAVRIWLDEFNGDPNAVRLSDGKALAHIAVQNNDLALMQLLLSFDTTNPNILDENNLAPLHFVTFSLPFRKPMAMALILDRRTDPNLVATNPGSGFSTSPLIGAITMDNRFLVEALLANSKTRLDLEVGTMTPLAAALANGNDYLASLLLRSGAIPNEDDIYRISVIPASFPETQRIILESASLAQQATELVFLALEKENPVWLQELLLRGKIGVRNAEGKTLLHVAVEAAYEEGIRLLLSTPGVDVNAVDNDGYTPLLSAIHGGIRAPVRLLLEDKRTDPNFPGKLLTPLIQAIVSDQESMLELLLSYPKTNPNFSAESIPSALTAALFYKKNNMAIILLEHGVEVTDSQMAYISQFPALLEAAQNGKMKSVPSESPLPLAAQSGKGPKNEGKTPAA